MVRETGAGLKTGPPRMRTLLGSLLAPLGCIREVGRQWLDANGTIRPPQGECVAPAARVGRAKFWLGSPIAAIWLHKLIGRQRPFREHLWGRRISATLGPGGREQSVRRA